MRRFDKVCLLCALLPRVVLADDLWAVWELELGKHAPPTHFLVTVTSTSPVPLPPPLKIPYATCILLQAATKPSGGARCTCQERGQLPGPQSFCAHIGCPPPGVYMFSVQAHYAEGLSHATSTTCTTTGAMQIPLADVPLIPPDGPALAVPPEDVATLPQPPPDTSGLAQPPADDASLRPVSTIPGMVQAPPIPGAWVAQPIQELAPSLLTPVVEAFPLEPQGTMLDPKEVRRAERRGRLKRSLPERRDKSRHD